jgi:hypothetical protein
MTQNIYSMLHIIFCAVAIKILAGVATGGGGGEELEVHMNLMPPEITKIGFFSFFWTYRAASHLRHNISARRVLKTKQLLDNRLGLHIFFKI